MTTPHANLVRDDTTFCLGIGNTVFSHHGSLNITRYARLRTASGRAMYGGEETMAIHSHLISTKAHKGS